MMSINSRYVMTSSALFMGFLGIVTTFLPQEILHYFDSTINSSVVIIIQITGALYLGFAILNWTARANIIGGIYSRPVSLGNFLHFAAVAISILKVLLSDTGSSFLIVAAVLYSIFTVLFGYILFTHPLKTGSSA